MAKGFGLGGGFLWGLVAGAAGLYLIEHLKGFSGSISISNPGAQGLTPRADKGTGTASYVGILPGNELPFYDDLDDSYVTSEVWDRRTSQYRNDGVLYNTVGRGGSGLMLDGTSGFDPNKGLNVAGAYGNSLERDERTRQQHAGGNYPECKSIAGEFSC